MITETLRSRGVILPRPDLVVIGAEVPLERIAAGAVLHPFTQLRGAETRVGTGAVIGEGGPCVLEDCVIGAGSRIGTMGPVTLRRVTCGADTVLGSGAAEDAVFLGKEVSDPAITCGLGFRARKGSLFEEDASGAQHTDTKMTILFPWATLGSNVNWCDLLMAGGTGPAFDQFSEVGSGAVHFNFTPRADKATASLLGDVCEGVFLRSARIFFGGNGSLIGPSSLAYGTVTAAAQRVSGEMDPTTGLQPGGVGPERPGLDRLGTFDPEVYGSVKRVFDSQVRYVAELTALDAWYAQARAMVATGNAEREALYAAGRAMVRMNLAERILQLGGMAAHMERSAAKIEKHSPRDPRIAQQRALGANWPGIEVKLKAYEAAQREMPEALRMGLEAALGRTGRDYTRPGYTHIVRALEAQAVAAGMDWLRGIAAGLATPELLTRVPPLVRS